MAYVDPIDSSLFSFVGLNDAQSLSVISQITDMSIGMSHSMSSELTVSLLDPGFTFARNNYFQIRRDVLYRGMQFEISAVEVTKSESIHPLYNIQCRSKAVQLMKRDKKPEAYRGMTAYDFAFAISQRFKLGFVGEKTTKKQSIVKGKSSNADDSVWTVLQSLASEQKFVAFESEGTLFFCSEKFLMGKWGDPRFTLGTGKFIPFFYPETNDPNFSLAKTDYVLMEQPTVRRSDDDVNAAEGTMLVDRYNGKNLRPGMTIWLGGIPDFESFYLITDVSFQEGIPDPVQVSFRLPVDPSKEKISSSTSSTSTTTASGVAANPISDPTDGGKTIPTSVKLENVRPYVRDALSRIQYRGPNGKFIADEVYAAVFKLLNKEASFDAIVNGIRDSAKLEQFEIQHAINIYLSFVAGKPSSSLGIAGGASAASQQQLLEENRFRYREKATNPTPRTSASAPTQPATGSGTTSTQQQDLSTSIFGSQDTTALNEAYVLIDTFINQQQKRYYGGSVAPTTLASLTDEDKRVTKLKAKYVFTLRGQESAKHKAVSDFHKECRDSTKNIRYDALRQDAVMKLIIPNWTSTASTAVPKPYKR